MNISSSDRFYRFYAVIVSFGFFLFLGRATPVRAEAVYVRSLQPSALTIGDTVMTIAGVGFGSQQTATRYVCFDQHCFGHQYTKWSDTEIQVLPERFGFHPAKELGGDLTVMVDGVKSNAIAYGILPVISNLNPSFVAVGDAVSVSGSYFGSQQGSIRIGSADAIVVHWDPQHIDARVPGAAQGNGIDITTTAGTISSAALYIVKDAHIDRIEPSSVVPDKTVVSIIGSGFGELPNDHKVCFVVSANDTFCLNSYHDHIHSWHDDHIDVLIPQGTDASHIALRLYNGFQLVKQIDGPAITLKPFIAAVDPKTLVPGSTATATVSYAGDKPGDIIVGSAKASIIEWSPRQDGAILVKFTVPFILNDDALIVKNADGIASDPYTFSPVKNIGIDSISPDVVEPGKTVITVNGHGFGNTYFDKTLFVGDLNVAARSWTDTQIQFIVPSGIRATFVKVIPYDPDTKTYHKEIQGPYFHIQPTIIGYQPTEATVGSVVEIRGTSFTTLFGSREGSNNTIVVAVGQKPADVIDWQEDRIRVKVPDAVGQFRVVVRISSSVVNRTLETEGPLLNVVAPVVPPPPPSPPQQAMVPIHHQPVQTPAVSLAQHTKTTPPPPKKPSSSAKPKKVSVVLPIKKVITNTAHTSLQVLAQKARQSLTELKKEAAKPVHLSLSAPDEPDTVVAPDVRLIRRLAGSMLVDKERKGLLWFINPQDRLRYFLGSSSQAVTVFGQLGIKELKPPGSRKSYAVDSAAHVEDAVKRIGKPMVKKDLYKIPRGYLPGELQ